MSVPQFRPIRQRPATPSERADAILAQIPDADLDALARALARVLISAAENRERKAAMTVPSDATRDEMRRRH